MSKQKTKQKKTKVVTCTEYRLMYRKKTDPDTWFIKCVSDTEEQVKRFMQVLEYAADIYVELKIEQVTVKK